MSKAEWGAGPWNDEEDRVEWRHAGFPCLMRRGPMGSWCGYVGVSESHPWYGKDYSDDVVDVDVHGGLTYGEGCHGEICHVPAAGESDKVWWFGFDCGHYMDFVPAFAARGLDFCEGIYRTQEYVAGQVMRLAEQLEKASKRGEGKA